MSASQPAAAALPAAPDLASGATAPVSPERSEQALFAASAEARARLQEVARRLLQGDDDDSDSVDAADVERLYAELMANYEAALRVFEKRFAELPYIEKLREKWSAYRLGDEDPVWAIVDVLTLYDARSQLVMSQVMNVITKGHDLMRVSVSRLERLSKNAGAAAGELAEHEAEFARARAATENLAKALAVYGDLQPRLLDAMARSQAENETATWRAKLQLMGIGAAVGVGGFLVGWMFSR